MNDRRALAARALLTLLGALVIAGAGSAVYAVYRTVGRSPVTVANATPAVSQAVRASKQPSASPSPPAGTAEPSPTVASTPPLPLLKAGSYEGKKPTSIGFSADGGNVVSSISWSSWAPTSAIGRGNSVIENCVPDCAQGGFVTVTATIKLSNPSGGFFTMMTETRDGHKLVWKYPNRWPLDAGR